MTRPSKPPGEVPAPTPPPAPRAKPTSVERVTAKESFSPDEPLPAFTYPAIDEATKQALLKSVEEAQARPKTSVERVTAKESFSPDEPLPAFTYPAIDEATKQELLKSVEEARAASAPGPASPPGVAPPTPGMPRKPPAPRFDSGDRLAELRRAGGDLWRRGSGAVVQGIDRACVVIDQNRAALPARIREPLKNVRAGWILAALFAIVLAAFVAPILLIRSGRARGEASVPAPSASASATPQEDTVPKEIEEAKKQGIPALEKLAERFPNHPRVWLELAAANSAKGIHAVAVGAVGKALAADREAGKDDVASAVLAAAVRKRDTSDAAFELLTGPMGTAGAAVLYDLSTDVETKPALRTRAEEWVRSDAFKKAADSDVELAGALRYAKSCSERHDLMTRAAEEGGRRTLDYLNIAKVRGGCGRRGRDDCFPCLRRDDAVKSAISAIEARLSPK